jgi:hypothetical protein
MGQVRETGVKQHPSDNVNQSHMIVLLAKPVVVLEEIAVPVKPVQINLVIVILTVGVFVKLAVTKVVLVVPHQGHCVRLVHVMETASVSMYQEAVDQMYQTNRFKERVPLIPRLTLQLGVSR